MPRSISIARTLAPRPAISVVSRPRPRADLKNHILRPHGRRFDDQVVNVEINEEVLAEVMPGGDSFSSEEISQVGLGLPGQGGSLREKLRVSRKDAKEDAKNTENHENFRMLLRNQLQATREGASDATRHFLLFFASLRYFFASLREIFECRVFA